MSHLRTLAERYNCAILLIEHLNKNIGGKGIYRGLGSIDVTAAARSILMLGSDPDNEQDKGIAHIKSNCGPMGKVVGFNLGKGGLVWNLHTTLTSSMIQGHNLHSVEREAPARSEAEDFLNDLLQDGKMASKEIEKEAREYGISMKTLRDAREKMGIVCARGKGDDRACYWQLAPEKNHSQIGANRGNLENNQSNLTLFDPICPSKMDRQVAIFTEISHNTPTPFDA